MVLSIWLCTYVQYHRMRVSTRRSEYRRICLMKRWFRNTMNGQSDFHWKNWFGDRWLCAVWATGHFSHDHCHFVICLNGKTIRWNKKWITIANGWHNVKAETAHTRCESSKWPLPEVFACQRLFTFSHICRFELNGKNYSFMHSFIHDDRLVQHWERLYPRVLLLFFFRATGATLCLTHIK